MSRRHDNYQARLALLALATNRTPVTPGQEQADGMNPENQTAVVARYLAAGGAIVTVTRTTAHRLVDTYTVDTDCEECGPLHADSATDEDYLPNVQVRSERIANVHAATCRRIPERLWSKAGAS